MKNIWRKMRDCWLDFWEDDELDMDKKHLSQHDKRSLLYGGFMIGVATFGLFSIGIIAGNIWTNHQNQKDMEEFLGTVVTYMATATASIDRGRGIVSAHKMKTHFCDDCIREILNIVEDEFIDEAVIYDAEEKTFYPVTEGDLQIGYYEDGGYEIEIAYTGE